MNPSPLRALLEPASVAVVGVGRSEESVGRRVWRNLVQGGFKGPVYAINPNVALLDGRAVHRSLAELPEAVELAVVAVPADGVLGPLEELAARGVRNAIVLSAGYGEMGKAGVAKQAELVRRARELGVRVLGPNCLGIMRAPIGLNASFSRGIGVAGSLALVSQSGAVCSAIVDWAEQRGIGLSSVVSLGAAADVGLGEVLDFLALDASTSAILVYVEGVDHARALFSGLRAAARDKPVIVVKAGRHEGAHRAAVSHTGAIVGNDAVFDALIRRAGAVRVATLHELFSAADVLTHSSRAQGARLALITNAGGLGVLAVDRAEDLALPLAQLSEATRAALREALPPHAARDNPIDVLGDAPPERYRAALAACLDDAEVDGVIVLLTPQAMTRPDEVASALAQTERDALKPVLACFMGGRQIEAARKILIDSDVACFDSPEAAVEAFATLASFARNQKALLQLPNAVHEECALDLAGSRAVIEAALAAGRSTLSQAESFALLAAFAIEHVASERASTLAAALAAAQRIGYPVALKIDSPDITHKTDVDGVRLGLADASALSTAHAQLLESVKQRAPKARVDGVVVQAMLRIEEGRDVLVGVSHDPALGPAIACGAGGTLVEVIGGAAVELPPLTSTLARALWQRSRIAPLLGAFRGQRPADIAGLERVLLRISDMVSELPELEELDINPLIVAPDRVVALDARIVVQRREPGARYGHLAIAPYPRLLTRQRTLPDGTGVLVRALRPEDGEIERRFLSGLSFKTKYLRFMHGVGEPSRRMLARLTQLDYDRELALLALTGDGQGELVGVARYVADADRASCEFAVAIADAHQGRGVGSLLTSALIDAARVAGIERIYGDVLADNESMLGMVAKLGFSATTHPADAQLYRVELELRQGSRPAGTT
jgi:acetyltransferase